MMNYCYHPSPIGSILLAGDKEKLTLISFPEGSKRVTPKPEWIEDKTPFIEVGKQLDAYFKGELKQFSLPLRPHGTPFQLKVLEELQKIPYGSTITYAELAVRVGNPKASRAVGNANGRNPLPIVIPCHRVIGSDGKLTGFGGGLPTKQKLLNLEKQYL